VGALAHTYSDRAHIIAFRRKGVHLPQLSGNRQLALTRARTQTSTSSSIAHALTFFPEPHQAQDHTILHGCTRRAHCASHSTPTGYGRHLDSSGISFTDELLVPDTPPIVLYWTRTHDAIPTATQGFKDVKDRAKSCYLACHTTP